LGLNLTSKQLIEDFLVLQKKLGRRPKLIAYTCQCHTPKALDRVFGKPEVKRSCETAGES
jgi:hypothetical protein